MNKRNIKLLRIFFSISHIFPSPIIVRIAEHLFTTPLSSDRGGMELKLLKKAEQFDIPQGKKNTIAAYRWGKKTDPVILFVHGWTSTGTCFVKFINPLISKGYQVISFDSIAHGKTHGAKSASITQWADTVTTVVKEVGKVHCIVGHSLGAGAIVIAAPSKLNVNKIVLISPVTNIIKVTEQFAKILLIPKKIITGMQHYAWDKYNKSASKYGDNWHDIFKSTIKVPTLIIHDLDDSEIDIKDTRELAKRIPQSSLLETKKLGHRRILLNPSIIRTTIKFISS